MCTCAHMRVHVCGGVRLVEEGIPARMKGLAWKASQKPGRVTVHVSHFRVQFTQTQSTWARQAAGDAVGFTHLTME